MDGSEPQLPAIGGLKIICRCNNIQYRTIERAIHEGAWRLAYIALWTTATTGHCGGSCTFDVLDILAEVLGPRSADSPPRPEARGLR